MSPRSPDPPARSRPPRVIQAAPIDASKLALARRFRREPTPAEAAAWRLLRARGLHGLKFRRQQIVAGFVVDCAGLRLALELDGGVHADLRQREYDAIRAAILSNLAIRIVRVTNDHVDEPFLRELLAPYALAGNQDRSRDGLRGCAFSEPPSPAERGGLGGEVCGGRVEPQISRRSRICIPLLLRGHLPFRPAGSALRGRGSPVRPASAGGDERVRAEPFEAVELTVRGLVTGEDEDSPSAAG